jgi:plasmid maintenance system antidote protein VapI
METTNKKITQRRIARSANIGPDFLNHIIQGRKKCPPKVAERLEAATGISKLVWVWGSPCDIRAAIQGIMCQK